MKKRLVFTFVLFQILDILTTYIALTYYGFREMNPIATYLMSHFGLFSLVYIKLAVVFIILGAYYLVKNKSKRIVKSFENSLSTGTVLTMCAVAINSVGLVAVSI